MLARTSTCKRRAKGRSHSWRRFGLSATWEALLLSERTGPRARAQYCISAYQPSRCSVGLGAADLGGAQSVHAIHCFLIGGQTCDRCDRLIGGQTCDRCDRLIGGQTCDRCDRQGMTFYHVSWGNPNHVAHFLRGLARKRSGNSLFTTNMVFPQSIKSINSGSQRLKPQSF